MYICIYTHIHIHIHTYTYVHIYIYMYMYIYKHSDWASGFCERDEYQKKKLEFLVCSHFLNLNWGGLP